MASLQSHAETIHALLKDCFWCKDIPLALVKKFLNHSLCFGIIHQQDNTLVGFGRVITDYTTFAYMADVIIADKHRRKKLASMLVSAIMQHPELQNLKSWNLKATDEAINIYLAHGFAPSKSRCPQLEINHYDIYTKSTNS